MFLLKDYALKPYSNFIQELFACYKLRNSRQISSFSQQVDAISWASRLLVREIVFPQKLIMYKKSQLERQVNDLEPPNE